MDQDQIHFDMPPHAKILDIKVRITEWNLGCVPANSQSLVFAFADQFAGELPDNARLSELRIHDGTVLDAFGENVRELQEHTFRRF